MNQPQEVIIYRGPLEYQLYNMSDDTLLWVIGIMAAVFFGVILYVRLEELYRRWKRRVK